jgi:hypothetical protein
MISLQKESLGKPSGYVKGKILAFALVLTVFAVVTCLLTYNALSLPSLVIGDNFNWTPQNVLDVIGPKVIRQSYMGDIAVASTFKTGFLFPLTYAITSLNLSSTLVYPALFYFLSMLAFYFLAKEFLSNKVFLVLSSILYVVNPVTPYYFASIINAFSLVLLPLSLKFFVRALESSPNSRSFVIYFVYSMFFLSLTVSANEQFILSALLLASFMALTLAVILYQKIGLSLKSAKTLLLSLSSSGAVFLIVNLPLLLSTINIQSAPWSTYFQGPGASRFLTTVDYTYRNADLSTILRMGGDSGTGLGQTSWYDSAVFTNIFGYLLLGLFFASMIILLLKKDTFGGNRTLFYGTIGLFFLTVLLILLMKSLPAFPVFQNSPLDTFLKTWENPAKLRVVLLLSLLVTSFVVLGKLEVVSRNNKFFGGLMVALILVGTAAYNSPWVVSYAGQTPMQEVAEIANWGSLYNQEYVNISDYIQEQGVDSRGIIIPYTHEAELYSSPNARIFQIVSQVNQQISGFVPQSAVPWSQILGMFSIKTVAVKNSFNPNEILIFPSNVNNNQTLNELKNDPNFRVLNQTNDYLILNNKNCLPMLYASNNYVFYDDLSTLGIIFNQENFADLPVFLQSSDSGSGLTIPSYVKSEDYKVCAVGLAETQGSDTQTLRIDDSSGGKNVLLQRTGSSENLTVYSSTQKLFPNDSLRVIEPSLNQLQTSPDSTLNSTSMRLDDFGSFTLNFNVKIIQNGNYSFLGPRVVLDSGNVQYYIIIHDNGTLELAVMQGGVFQSMMITRFVGYSLLDPQSSINVKVQRVLGQVTVSVQGTQYLSFSTEPKYVHVDLTSEHSVSAYSNITLSRDSSFRLFAVRKTPTPISYIVHSSSAEQSAITINSNITDFAVVSQYLYTNLTHINNGVSNTEVQANVLYKAWIINQANHNAGDIYISINTANRELTLLSVGLAITFSYVLLLLLVLPIKKCLNMLTNCSFKKKLEKTL